jgi:hypothetical protein
MRQSSGIAGLRRTLGQGIFGLDVSLTVGDTPHSARAVRDTGAGRLSTPPQGQPPPNKAPAPVSFARTLFLSAATIGRPHGIHQPHLAPRKS